MFLPWIFLSCSEVLVNPSEASGFGPRITSASLTRGMLVRAIVAIIAALQLIVSGAQAHGPNDPPHQLHPLGEFKLESAEVTRYFSISYVTDGTLNESK